ncbi:condensation domain-containing protein [Acidimangrovimonas sediminis]|uniref:condensation domain-containing protein n=1 Tax=Acidimangrovimonas sediminis TaxID=2056283 RepID=UPI000C80232E|nr:condensation domain-containing protein [Acidimangrovimonas sediminis]
MDGAANPTPQPAIARFPVSTAQRQMWFIDQLMPDDPTLNVAIRWNVTGPVRSDSIEAAYQAVIARHEILRSRFVLEGGEPVQEVVDQVPFRLGVVDLRGVPEAQHAARVDEIAANDAGRPFDLTRPGLIRATLVRLGPERAVLLTGVHHIVFDGSSIGVLGHEIGTFAAAFEAGRPPEMEELPLQYGDYALWQRDYLASGVEAEDAAYWAGQMKDAPYFEIRPDKPRPMPRSTAIARVGCDLPAGTVEKLGALARDQGVSLFTLGAAVAAGVLARVAGTDEVLMSTPISGRIDTDLEGLIGPFINHHVLRLPTRPETTLADHLATARTVVEEALAHQALPFAKLVEVLNPPRDASRAPFSGVGFNLMHVFYRGARYGSFEMASAPAFASGSAQDLSLLLVGRPGAPWRLSVEYCPDLYEAASAEALRDTLARALVEIAEGARPALADLPLAPALAERPDGTPRPGARIEEVLSSHPEVSAAAAVPAGEGNACFAFVSPRADSLVPLETLPQELMGFAARRLVPAERPIGISVLAALPRRSSGDLDRARLPRPLIAAATAQPFVPAPGASPAPAAAAIPPAATQTAAAHQPDGAVEPALSALWSELLERTDIPRDVSFFDLGGHSLLAVRLMARIRERWALRLGVATLYQSPTLAGLAARVATDLGLTPVGPPATDEDVPSRGTAEAAPAPATGTLPDDTLPDNMLPDGEDWRIEPILTEGSAQQIIAVNDVGLILDTAQYLSDRHPALCVRLFDGTRGIDRSPRSFEQIAAEYAATIRAAQPSGPYLLFGVCVHGNIALEAARILKAEGEEVAVVIKDVWEPGYAQSLKRRRLTRWAERFYALGNKIRMVRMGTMSLEAMLGSYRILRRSGVLALARRLGLIGAVRATDLAPEQERFVSYISAARNRYRPAEVDFPVLHVVTRITAQGRLFLPSVGWEKVVRPDLLTTVALEEVVVTRGLRVGTRDLARAIDAWSAARHRIG